MSQEEEEKVPQININGEPQESGEKALNILMIGPSGSGKSSLINFLAGKEVAKVGHDGDSCTKYNASYNVTFENIKLRIFDTQGFNDTDTGFTNGNGNVASKIKFQLMNNSSTKQIDAIWIVQSCTNTRSYLDAMIVPFESFIGKAEILKMTTVIISHCDMMMEKGDFFQLPNRDPFKVPEEYNGLRDSIKKERFWVKIMQAGQPFLFSKGKKLYTKPICWTNVPEKLESRLNMSAEDIKKKQMTLLIQSLKNSTPARPQCLQEYDIELTSTANYFYDLEKTLVLKDELKDGTFCFTYKIDASLKEEEKQQQKQSKENKNKAFYQVGWAVGFVGGCAVAVFAAPAAFTYLSATALATTLGTAGTFGAATVTGTATIAGVLGTSKVTGTVALNISDSIKSDVWIERTFTQTYEAPEDHEIIADPSTDQTGNGRLQILERNKRSFKFQLTVFTGEFIVVFTSHEKWMHKASTKEFEYRKSMPEYKEYFKNKVAKEIEVDTTGNFDVINFLKSERVAKALK